MSRLRRASLPATAALALLVALAGRVKIAGPGGCALEATLPFTRRLPAGCG